MKLLSRSELKKMLEQKEDFLLLNVLSAASFQQSHIPGSQNVSVADGGFVTRVESILGDKDKNYPIVTYCGGFHCDASKNAANLLTEAGHTNVSAFEGGMEDWLGAGYATSCTEDTTCKKSCA